MSTSKERMIREGVDRMEKYHQILEDFLKQLESTTMPTEATAYDFRIAMDPTINSFDMDFYILNRTGNSIAVQGQEKLQVITNGYEEMPEDDFKEMIEGLFGALYTDGHGHFDRATYVTFSNEMSSYYVQGDKHVSVGTRGNPDPLA